MTDPLVPPEVDLRDYDYIPLYGDRLFNSDTWTLCDADEKVAALRLWWRAWHEEPAGSLPDNDRLLADRAGYGVAVKAFLGVKENAMRGWIQCSDGRLYHPVVASIALDVWKARLGWGAKIVTHVGLTLSDWDALRKTVYARDGVACTYCGATKTTLECDHVIPLSRGGTNDIANLATACAHCNRSKGRKLLSEWRHHG